MHGTIITVKQFSFTGIVLDGMGAKLIKTPLLNCGPLPIPPTGFLEG